MVYVEVTLPRVLQVATPALTDASPKYEPVVLLHQSWPRANPVSDAVGSRLAMIGDGFCPLSGPGVPYNASACGLSLDISTSLLLIGFILIVALEMRSVKIYLHALDDDLDLK